MDYGELLERTWRLIWQHRFLLALGAVIAALSDLGDITAPIVNLLSNRGLASQPPDLPLPPAFQRLPALPDAAQLLRLLFRVAAPFGVGGWVAAGVLVLLIFIVLGLTLIVARGALIAAANSIESGTPTTLSAAIRMGWHRAWRLIIIASIPPIPITIALILIVIVATAVIQRAGGVDIISQPGEARRQVLIFLAAISVVISCPFAILTIALGLLRPLADRACVVEGARAVDSYRLGWSVLRGNLASVLILLLFQLGIQVIVGSILLLPQLLASLCFLALPPLWILIGAMQAYFITLWTLAWRVWTVPLIKTASTVDSL